MAVVIQRPLRGSRISSFYPVKNLPSLASLDSAFQLQEYISLLIRLDVHDVDSIVSVPGKGAGGDKEKPSESGVTEEVKGEEKEVEKERKSEIAVDEACWIYEQLRRLAQDLSHPLITMLQQECTRASCPEMKAGEWLYLCVAHGNDGAMEQCCAIDYILHTLDSATALLNSPRAFPSRLSIPQTSHRHFSSLARRLGRIFAHAYFHHREAFEQAEAESSLYARFLALTSKFDLVPAEFLVIPPRLTLNDDGRGEDRRGMDVSPPRLLAASIDPQGDRERQRLREMGGATQDWERAKDRSKSPPGLGNLAGTESPRKMGRNRTDTMVFSEAYIVAEELAKADQEESAPAADTVDGVSIEGALGTSDTGTVLQSAIPEAGPSSAFEVDLVPAPEDYTTSYASLEAAAESLQQEEDGDMSSLPEPVASTSDEYADVVVDPEMKTLVTPPPVETNETSADSTSSENDKAVASSQESSAEVEEPPIAAPAVDESEKDTEASPEEPSVTDSSEFTIAAAADTPAGDEQVEPKEVSAEEEAASTSSQDIPEDVTAPSAPESEPDATSISADVDLAQPEIAVEDDSAKEPVSSSEPEESSPEPSE